MQMPVGIFECISESWNQYVQGKIDEQAQRREAMHADALQEPTVLQLRPEEIVNEAVEYKDIRLDSQLFIGRNHSKLHAKHDNSCFVSDFIDERGQQSLAYGILKTIYAHTVRGETRYFLFPTWYLKAKARQQNAILLLAFSGSNQHMKAGNGMLRSSTMFTQSAVYFGHLILFVTPATLPCVHTLMSSFSEILSMNSK